MVYKFKELYLIMVICQIESLGYCKFFRLHPFHEQLPQDCGYRLLSIGFFARVNTSQAAAAIYWYFLFPRLAAARPVPHLSPTSHGYILHQHAFDERECATEHDVGSTRGV